jgi:hypothetical protein
MPHRRIRIGCTFTYVAEIDTPVIFQVKPRAAADMAIDHERSASEPYMPIRGYEDLYENPCIRAVLPAGRSTFGYEGVAVVPDAAEDAPGYRRVQSICSYVHGHLDFQYGSSTAGSSAETSTRPSAGDETRPTWRWPRPSAARSLKRCWSRPRRCPGDARHPAGTAIRRPGGAAVRSGQILFPNGPWLNLSATATAPEAGGHRRRAAAGRRGGHDGRRPGGGQLDRGNWLAGDGAQQR